MLHTEIYDQTVSCNCTLFSSYYIISIMNWDKPLELGPISNQLISPHNLNLLKHMFSRYIGIILPRKTLFWGLVTFSLERNDAGSMS